MQVRGQMQELRSRKMHIPTRLTINKPITSPAWTLTIKSIIVHVNSAPVVWNARIEYVTELARIDELEIGHSS